MMFSSLLFAGVLLQAVGGATTPTQTPAPVKPPADFVVLVAAPVYQPDGGITAETVALPQTGAGVVHLFSRRSLCNPAVAGTAEPADALFGWRIASQIVNRTERDVVVSIDWRRLWDDGRKVPNGPGATVQLTLHAGDRIPLDHIPNAKPTQDCRAVGLGLEVRLAQAEAAGPSKADTLPLAATAGGAKPVDAEFWLLHTLPSDVQQVIHQTVRLSTEGGRFAFAPTTLATARGDVSVEFSGSIDRYSTPTGELLLLYLTRRVKGGGLPPDGIPGTTSSFVPMVANEVIAFEMPPTVRGRAPGGVAGGGARSGGGAGGVVTAPPPAQARGGAAAGVGAPQSRVLAGGGRGGGTATAGAAQIASLLEGHQFALRMRIVPVPGS